MGTSLLIQNEALARRLFEIADLEASSIEAVLWSFVEQYDPLHTSQVEPTNVRDVTLGIYTRARRYWESIGDRERATLSDSELDEHFWCFDNDGIPRLKSDDVIIHDYSLIALAEAGEAFARQGIPSDLSEKGRDLLGEILIKHHEQNPH